MQSQPAQSESPQPQRSESPDAQNSASGRKRKRRTFACYDCRRRKLRCGREWPACARCRASGSASTCVYDTAPGYTGEHPPASGTGRPDEQFEPRAQYRSPTHREPNGFQPFQRSVPQEDAYSVIQRQAERIAALEACLARIEPRSGSENHHEQNRALESTNPLPGRFDSHLMSDMEENRRPPDTVAIGGEDAFVFRGKGFKTQFYGPSSPMSAILNSHLILKFVGTLFLLESHFLCFRSMAVRD
jgi:hypothetical protein